MFTVLHDTKTIKQGNEDGNAGQRQDALFKELSDLLDADIFLYSGPVERPVANLFLDVAAGANKRSNAVLILCTYGGDADAAYIIARFLKRTYKKFTLYVFGYCKSAGTLIALGADEIVMSIKGELGPLDVQLLKADNLFFRGSGLDIDEAIESLSEQAFEIFEKHLLGIIEKSSGSITTKTAADIASTLAVGLLSPITAQIDPLHVGEVERAINIAYQYGIRLNGDEGRINRLVSDYPSHSFVIDFDEAKQIFENVRQPNATESRLELVLQDFKDEQGRKLVCLPHLIGVVAYLNPREEVAHEQKQQENQQIINTEEDDSSDRSNGNQSKKNKKHPAKHSGKAGKYVPKTESVNPQNGRRR